MSFGVAGSTDIGVKVMRLLIPVLGCDLDDIGVLSSLYAKTYGFAYDGSLSNTSTFKQFIEDMVISGVQGIVQAC